MDERRDRTGERLGPYHLDKRYEGLDEPGGQLYAAHHVETGRSALVLVPEPDDHWAPRSDWTARVTSQTSPPFLATELEHPPPADAEALSDVDLAFIRMAGGIAAVEEREDAHIDFTQPPRRSSRQSPGGRTGRRRVRPGSLIAAALLLVAGVLWVRLPGPPERMVNRTDASHAEPTFWLDQKEGTAGIGYPMPEVAYPEQMKPPCGGGGYLEIRGGCWVQTTQTVPCKGTAEYEGKCYVPVREKKPEPRSIKH